VQSEGGGKKKVSTLHANLIAATEKQNKDPPRRQSLAVHRQVLKYHNSTLQALAVQPHCFTV